LSIDYNNTKSVSNTVNTYLRQYHLYIPHNKQFNQNNIENSQIIPKEILMAGEQSHWSVCAHYVYPC